MEIRRILTTHSFIWLFASLIVFASTKPLIDVSMAAMALDSLTSGALFSILFFFLKLIARYSYYSSLNLRQQLINYGALAILFTSLWIGIEYLMLYTFLPESDWLLFQPTIIIRIVVALLSYCLVIAIYNAREDLTVEEETVHNEEHIEEIEEEAQDSEIIERVVVKNNQKIDIIPVSEIIHLQAEGDYVMIHSAKGKFLKEQTMKSFEQQLDCTKFVRVHRSSIINVDYIAQIELYDKQSQLLKLKNGSLVKISLSGYKLLKATLGL